MITRLLEQRLYDKCFKGKAILLIGSRQTGKTTLLKAIFEKVPLVCWLNGDEAPRTNKK